ncbi:MAG: hypothetical protein U1F55_09810 [Chitinivorax sp.]
MAGFLYVKGMAALCVAAAKVVIGDNDIIVAIIANLGWLASGK